MTGITYLSPDCHNSSLFKTVFIKPYKQSWNNFKICFQNSLTYTTTGKTGTVNQHKYFLSLNNRIKHFVAGCLLLIPCINSLAILILRNIDRYTIASVTKIQSAYRRRKACKAYKTMQKIIKEKQPSKPKKTSLLQRLKQVIFSKNAKQITSRATGVDVDSAVASSNYLILTGMALRKGKFKVAGLFAMTAIGNGINATINLVIPKEVRQLNKLTQAR